MSRDFDTLSLTELPSNGTDSVNLTSPDNIPVSLSLRLPPSDGVAGTFIQTDGVGNLSFAAGGGTTFPDNTFGIYDNLLPASIIRFTADSLAGSTRTFTAPNSNGILPGLYSTGSLFLGSLNNTSTATNTTSLGVNSTLNIIGVSNTGVGSGSLPSPTGASNVCIGSGSGTAITSGASNTFIGKSSGTSVTTASNNVSIGVNSLSGVTGDSNVNIGSISTPITSSRTSCTSVGTNSLGILTSGSGNVSIGGNSLGNTVSASSTVSIGKNSMSAGNVTGTDNISIGTNALMNITTGINNTAFGTNSLTSLTTSSNNTAFGYNTGPSTIGDDNILIGASTDLVDIGVVAYVTSGIANDDVTPFNLLLNVIDPIINTVSGTVPDGIAITPDGNYAYVAMNNVGDNMVVPLNLFTYTAGAAINVGGRPKGVAITPDGSFAYVATLSNQAVKISTLTNTVVATPATGTNPKFPVVTPNGLYVYVTCFDVDLVYKISVSTNLTVTTIPVGTSPEGIAVTPDGASVYCVNRLSNNVSKISTASDTVTATISVGTFPIGIAISPSGTKAYVSNVTSNTVTPIDLTTDTAGVAIAGFSAPFGIVFSSDGLSAYVCNTGVATVSKIDVASDTITATIVGFTGAKYIALSPLPGRQLSGQIVIGNGTQTTCIIAGISPQTSTSGVATYINTFGKIGTAASSRRFKRDISPITEKDSSRIHDTEQVSFYYTSDPLHRAQYGMVAEDTLNVIPELVVFDDVTRPYAIQYHLMLPLIIKELQLFRKEKEEIITNLRSRIEVLKLKLSEKMR